MRLSEKTLELNFASQMNHHFGGNLIWFGLTQKQEAKAGFDIATNIGTGLFIVQMKASNNLLKSGARQFRVPHDQLQKLLNIKLTPAGVPIPNRSVMYAFPTIGSTSELTKNPDVFANTWLCDVMSLGALGPPTIKVPAGYAGAAPMRKSLEHYVDVTPGEAPLSPLTLPAVGSATFHSEPVEVSTQSGRGTFVDMKRAGTAEFEQRRAGLLEVLTDNNFEEFWRVCELFERKAFGIVTTS